MTVKAFAPAKLNLALHVTGQRSDGYHLLDSLVVFADVGDRIEVTDAPDLSLTVSGPRAAGVPTGPENLVLKAARLLSPGRGAAIHLEKHLPSQAGIGGGSSDAAATIRALCELWQIELDADPLTLGADVPVCLAMSSARMQGIGERLEPLPPLPPLWVVLCNPGAALPTPAVFGALGNKSNLPIKFPPSGAFLSWLKDQRNDLQEAAVQLAPQVGACLALIAQQKGVAVTRMSGSGATCFGLFKSSELADLAARNISGIQPNWWTVSTSLLR